MATISWSTSIQVQCGPTVSASQSSLVAEAIDRIEVTIPENIENNLLIPQPPPSRSKFSSRATQHSNRYLQPESLPCLQH